MEETQPPQIDMNQTSRIRHQKWLVDGVSLLLLIIIVLGMYIAYKNMIPLESEETTKTIDKINYMESLENIAVDSVANSSSSSDSVSDKGVSSGTKKVSTPPKSSKPKTTVYTVPSTGASTGTKYSMPDAEQKASQVESFDSSNYQFVSAEEKLRQMNGR